MSCGAPAVPPFRHGLGVRPQPRLIFSGLRTRGRRVAAVALVLATLLSTQVGALTAEAAGMASFAPNVTFEDQILQHAGSAPGDQFGKASAMSGSTLVVGTAGDDHGFLNDGAAYVFDKVGASWVPTQKITSPMPQAQGQFGVSVAIDGNTMAVGAFAEALDLRGRAYIFERVGGTWVHQRTIDGFAVGGLPASARLGWQVAVSGNYFAVTSIGTFTVHVFRRDAAGTGGWSNVPVAQLPGGGGSFGSSISMSGNILAIGAVGVSRVFLYDALTNFALHATITGPGAEAFSYAVAIDGNTLAVGAPGVDTGAILNHGGVYVYERHFPTANAWGLIALAKPGEVAACLADPLCTVGPLGRQMGNSVAIAGDLILAGAISDDWNGSETGSAYAYQRNEGGANTWGEINKLLASNGVPYNYAGFSVATNGTTAFVGAPGYIPQSPSLRGQGYIHELDVGPPPTPAAPGYVLDAYGGIAAGGGAAPVNPPSPYFGFDAAVDMELVGASGVLVLDAFGGLVPAGGAFAPLPPTPYFGFRVAADVELAPVGYYVLDSWGGVHAGGGAPVLLPRAPYFGFDIARDLEVVPNGYYVLDGFGALHGGGAAIPVAFPTYFPFDVAEDLELFTAGYYVLDALGGVHAEGGAPVMSPGTPYFAFDIARDLELAPTGYYVLDGFGGVHPGGGAPAMFPATPYYGFDVARDLELR